MKTEATLVLPVFFFFLLPSSLPFTFSTPSIHLSSPHRCDPVGALQQKVLLAQPERLLKRLFLDPAFLLSLSLSNPLPGLAAVC